MKNRSTKLFAFLVAGMLATSACNDAQNDKAKEMADEAAANVDTAVDKLQEGGAKIAGKIENAIVGNPDSNFVIKATVENNMQLRLLQEGADKGTDRDLKAHAKMMIADHKKLGAGINAYAAKKGYLLPEGDNGTSNDELMKLSKKTKGAEWDEEWAEELLAEHKDAVDMFEKWKDKVNDQELKMLITDALPTLRSHVDMLIGLEERIGK